MSGNGWLLKRHFYIRYRIKKILSEFIFLKKWIHGTAQQGIIVLSGFLFESIFYVRVQLSNPDNLLPTCVHKSLRITKSHETIKVLTVPWRCLFYNYINKHRYSNWMPWAMNRNPQSVAPNTKNFRCERNRNPSQTMRKHDLIKFAPAGNSHLLRIPTSARIKDTIARTRQDASP